jgi:ribosomal protein S27AE
MIEISSVRAHRGFVLPVSKHSKFTAEKVDCEACGMTAPRDGRWGRLCGKCGAALRAIDAVSVSRIGIQREMWLMGVPVKWRREGVD